MLFRYESNNLMQQATNQVNCFIMQQTCHFNSNYAAYGHTKRIFQGSHLNFKSR